MPTARLPLTIMAMGLAIAPHPYHDSQPHDSPHGGSAPTQLPQQPRQRGGGRSVSFCTLPDGLKSISISDVVATSVVYPGSLASSATSPLVGLTLSNMTLPCEAPEPCRRFGCSFVESSSFVELSGQLRPKCQTDDEETKRQLRRSTKPGSYNAMNKTQRRHILGNKRKLTVMTGHDKCPEHSHLAADRDCPSVFICDRARRRSFPNG